MIFGLLVNDFSFLSLDLFVFFHGLKSEIQSNGKDLGQTGPGVVYRHSQRTVTVDPNLRISSRIFGPGIEVESRDENLEVLQLPPADQVIRQVI